MRLLAVTVMIGVVSSPQAFGGAGQGDAAALFAQGVQLETGAGVAGNGSKALEMFRKSAELGYPNAQYTLGVRYAVGQGVTRDMGTAIEWHRKAAAQDYAPAQRALGIAYYEGAGVEKDAAEAFKWTKAAAGNGDCVATYNLGQLYASGHGVARNTAEADKLFFNTGNVCEPLSDIVMRAVKARGALKRTGGTSASGSQGLTSGQLLVGAIIVGVGLMAIAGGDGGGSSTSYQQDEAVPMKPCNSKAEHTFQHNLFDGPCY